MTNKGDIKILSIIAEYKYLTIKQISILCQRSIQIIRRRIRSFFGKGLIVAGERVFSEGVGRKESVIIISDKGLKILKDKKIISKHATYITDKTSDLFFVEHDLLVNWFLIHLLQIERINQRFKILFFTTSSHNLAQGDSRGSLIMEHFLNNDKPDKTYTMIPDGVFTITDKKTNRSLLFFLEVDMGSETVASPTQSQKDIKQKVNNYQALFKYETYKKYNNITNCKFNGFRLLFLTNTRYRMESICRLVQSISPSGFIWVTNQQQVFSKGAAAEIWAKGGYYKKKPQSIFKKLTFKAPSLIE